MSSRVLVTGGAGFIGSHVVDALRHAGHEPVVYDLRPSPWHSDVETVIGDLCDTERLTEALAGCDAVAHLAASADVDEVARDPLGAERINSRGTASLLEAARRAEVDRVVYASTIWVYSDVDAAVVDEDAPLHPPSHLYTATKLAGELYCRSYAELYGLEYTVLRFGIPYGPRARPAAVVPAMVGRALAGEPLTIAGDGLQTRRFVYVEDLAEGVVRGLAPCAANRIYNLVSDEDVSIRRVAETVGAAVGETEILYTPGRSGDFGGVEVDGSRAERELGWTASTSFEEGVRRYVASVRSPAPATVPVTRPLAERLATVRRLLAPLALLGVIVAVLSAAGSLEQIADKAPLAALAMAVALPVALVRTLDWAPAARKRLATGFWALAGGLLVALLTPLHGTQPAHDHPAVVGLLVASSCVAAVLAMGGPLPAWRERLSD
ncbi:MAG: NAD-dependent epimerase/dehydratase family protein [Solirubrobacteraceae bacterium]